MQITKTSDTRYLPVFERILEDIPGGKTINVSYLPSDKYEVKEGTLVGALGTSGLFGVIKTAQLETAISSVATSLRVDIRNHLKVGDFLTDGTATPKKITSITRGTTYDTVVLSADFNTSMAADTILFEPLASNATTPKMTAAGITRDTFQFREEDGTARQNLTVGVVVRGTVNESLMPCIPRTAHKTSLSLIRFV